MKSNRTAKKKGPEIWHNLRRYVLSVYEKHGYDKAIDLVKTMRMIPKFRSGLLAELIFYHKYQKEFSLEPLLDAGVKADYGGMREGKLVNFDVTTNLSFKNMDDYVNVVQRRRKQYDIALVNPKSEDVEFLPLKFPICRACNKFAHHLVYVLPPGSDTYWSWHMSDQQVIMKYCTHCGKTDEIQSYSYGITMFSYLRDYLAHEEEVDSNLMYTDKEVDDRITHSAISTVKLFEKTSSLLVSAIAENDVFYTYKQEGGETYGRLLWTHPLARDLGTELDFHYGPWLS